jgi:hypothetical protein
VTVTAVSSVKQSIAMKLGALSVWPSIKELAISRSFYEKLGFEVFGGNVEHNWRIMKNGHCLKGLFEGMFSGNMPTINSGWDQNAATVDPFNAVRCIQETLKAQEINLHTEADTSTQGPASIMLHKTDGNILLIDQHR